MIICRSCRLKHPVIGDGNYPAVDTGDCAVCNKPEPGRLDIPVMYLSRVSITDDRALWFVFNINDAQEQIDRVQSDIAYDNKQIAWARNMARQWRRSLAKDEGRLEKAEKWLEELRQRQPKR